MTYDAETKHGHIKTNTGWTLGGYSGSHTVNERFIVTIPDGFPLEAAGPIFCAGITMFSPLAQWKADKGGMNVGIIGIGGLGQMGVMLAKARGIGADNFVVSTSPESVTAAAGSLDLILNT